MDKSYRVQEDIKCCCTCDFCVIYEIDVGYICTLCSLYVNELGICDKYKEQE